MKFQSSMQETRPRKSIRKKTVAPSSEAPPHGQFLVRELGSNRFHEEGERKSPLVDEGEESPEGRRSTKIKVRGRDGRGRTTSKGAPEGPDI